MVRWVGGSVGLFTGRCMMRMDGMHMPLCRACVASQPRALRS